MYYIRIYHDIAKIKDYNGTINSPSMPLSPSASVQSHRVDVLLSPIETLSIDSHHFFTIFILTKTTEMQVRERITAQNIKTSRNGENSPKHLWPTVSRVDPGLKDRVLDGAL
jgi:hypothetical protein